MTYEEFLDDLMGDNGSMDWYIFDQYNKFKETKDFIPEAVVYLEFAEDRDYSVEKSLEAWAKDNIVEDYHVFDDYYTWFFKSAKDAMLFKLTWG